MTAWTARPRPRFVVGDRVNWTPGGSRGYGWTGAAVAAVVVSVNAKTITVRVARRRGGEWEIVERRVSPDRLAPRGVTVERIDLDALERVGGMR